MKGAQRALGMEEWPGPPIKTKGPGDSQLNPPPLLSAVQNAGASTLLSTEDPSAPEVFAPTDEQSATQRASRKRKRFLQKLLTSRGSSGWQTEAWKLGLTCPGSQRGNWRNSVWQEAQDWELGPLPPPGSRAGSRRGGGEAARSGFRTDTRGGSRWGRLQGRRTSWRRRPQAGRAHRRLGGVDLGCRPPAGPSVRRVSPPPFPAPSRCPHLQVTPHAATEHTPP